MTATISTLAVLDRDFRAARPRTDAPPTRFYLNLTERCQLRCAHCITHAPERTAEKIARDMSTAVIEALAPHLAHAAYVGFTHAGEPTIAPALEPVLKSLHERRAGAPTVVHLLTNGIAVDADRFLELTKLGVSSWSVSIDGVSAATNDLLRIGARIDRLLPKIRAISVLRKSEPAVRHARLGVAWTLTRSNAAELDQLIRFSADAGLDWVKVEEVYPINDRAAFEASIARADVEHTVARATELAASLGVRLLDHTREHEVWKCKLDEDASMKRFSLLDDYANRMEINPCRLPYELVCVEPDGDVKPSSFHHPPAGNVLRDDLLAIWSSPPFVELRERTAHVRICKDQPPSCAADPGPASW